MRSVSIPGTTTLFSDAMPQMHKSFRDYIMGTHAPSDFRILTQNAELKIARSCLDNIVKAGSGRCNVSKYAVTHWYEHLQEAMSKGARCDDETMWKLLGEMANEGVVGVWMRKESLRDIFLCVATTGYCLFEVSRKP